jgi:DNA-binding SARP family transcriptional activator
MDGVDARYSERNAPVRFLLLGPVQVIVGDQAMPLGGAGIRTVLAMLLLEPNQVVSLDRIVDTLWAHERPADARKKVDVYVSHLRRRLSEGGVYGA